MKTYYQPECDDKGFVKGHKKIAIWSFMVWRTKKNLMELFPNCIPITYHDNDIEDPTYADDLDISWIVSTEKVD